MLVTVSAVCKHCAAVKNVVQAHLNSAGYVEMVLECGHKITVKVDAAWM